MGHGSSVAHWWASVPARVLPLSLTRDKSIYEGTSFLRNLKVEDGGEVTSKLETILREGFDDEILRYADVIRDQGNPIARIRIPTTTQEAVDFLSARVRSLLGEPGADVDWEVVLNPLEGTP